MIADAARITQGEFSVALSGGHSPWPMYEALGDEDVAWDAVRVLQVDERIAPHGDEDRNLTALERVLPAPAFARLEPMPVEEDDPEAAAANYAARLPHPLALAHLGLGPDGHTASLVPGDPVLDVADRTVAITGEYQGRRRMTMTYPYLDSAQLVLWLVTGEDKRDALAKLLAGDPSIPAGRIRAVEALVVADTAATG